MRARALILMAIFSTFVDECFFSDNGAYALVSELQYVRFADNWDRFPVFGLYKLGKNEVNRGIAISNDSVYFFNDTLITNRIDSVVERKLFFEKFRLINIGKNITNEIDIQVSEKYLSQQNTIELLKLNLLNNTYSADSTKFYDYFISFSYNGKTFFNDTILNSYADKKHLVEGLFDFEKKEIWSEEEKVVIGTIAYGTIFYFDKVNSMIFIRAKYDKSSYVEVKSFYELVQINPETKKERIVYVNTIRENINEPIEIRELMKY